MRKILTVILSAAVIATSLTACSSNVQAPVQSTKTLPAPVQSPQTAPASGPVQNNQSSSSSAPVQNARTLPAPAQGPQSVPPAPQGITVNFKNFTIVDPNNLPDKQKDLLEQYKTSKGYIYWQEDGEFFVVIFAGEKPSAGYVVAVKGIEDNEGKTNILIDVTAPKGMAAAVITYPYTVVKVSGITDNFNIKDTNGDTYSPLHGVK